MATDDDTIAFPDARHRVTVGDLREWHYVRVICEECRHMTNMPPSVFQRRYPGVTPISDGIPESRRFPIIADSARPETISYLDGKGFCISGAAKGKSSVEDGIAFMQSKRIVVHPRCKETFQELKLHKYRRHHQTDVIMPKTEDANNHYIDALRYAWEAKWSKSGPMIRVVGYARQRLGNSRVVHLFSFKGT